MVIFHTKIIVLINNITAKNRDKPEYVKCDNYNAVTNMGCFGYHNPVISLQCFRCICLDRYNWLYIVIDSDLNTVEIDNLRAQGLYVHQSLLDVEAGLMPCDLMHHIQDTIDENIRYRGLVFATRNAEALEALTYYGSEKGYYIVYIHDKQVINDYKVLEKLFNSGFRKLLADIKEYRKKLRLK